LHERGVRVPEDVIVTGFDDVEFSKYTSPSLTTVAFDRRAFADAALSLLESRMDDRAAPPRAVTLPHHLLERDSTRATPLGYRP
jgi:DNA-binding LacI/PurR family transcriptional regulator